MKYLIVHNVLLSQSQKIPISFSPSSHFFHHFLKIQAGNLSKIIEKINGVARCPYDPRHNSTAVITSQGELYAATVIDFSGRDPAIYRSLGNVPPLRTAQYNSKWLNGKNSLKNQKH